MSSLSRHIRGRAVFWKKLPSKYLVLSCVAMSVLALDQLTKLWIRANIEEGHGTRNAISVIPDLFRLVHAENRAGAWGLLSSVPHRMPILIVATLIAFVVIGIYFHNIPRDQPLMVVALSLILGGAIGNFIDRALFGSVTDWLGFYAGIEPAKSWLSSTFGSNLWPPFNVADMGIFGGMALLLFDRLILDPRREAREISSDEGESPDGDGGRSVAEGSADGTNRESGRLAGDKGCADESENSDEKEGLEGVAEREVRLSP